MNLAVIDCPRCPSDTADWEPVTTSHGILIDVIYICRICGLTWDDAGYIDEPQETRITLEK